MNKPKTTLVAALALASLCVVSSAEAQQQPAQQAAPQLPQAPNMTFFVTSAGPGKGADLGGLEGADRYCQQLAQRHGAPGFSSRAMTLRQLLAIPVGAFKPAEIGALAGPGAGDKERHIWRLRQLWRRLLRRLLLCLGAGDHAERRERQCGDEGCLGFVHGCPSLLRFPATKALA